MSDANFSDEQTLASLLTVSLTPAGRYTLAHTIPTLLSLLPTPPLLPRLRLLRNLCAGNSPNQSSFISHSGPTILLSLILSRPPPQTLNVALQILGNAALGGEPHREAVWRCFFPDALLEIARVRDEKVCGTLCMVVDTCCSGEGGGRRVTELCRETGIGIVIEIVETASVVGYQQEWLEWLMVKICIEEQYMFLVFQRLGLDGGFSKEQAFLMRVLSKCLTERPGEVMIQTGFCLCVFDILKRVSGDVDFYARGSSALPTSDPDVDVLGYSLNVLRDVCAFKDPGAGEDYVMLLLAAGLLDLLLGFLRELEPPSVVKKAMMKGSDKDGPAKVCPYKGFRKDVVSVICNSLRCRKQAQDEIRERNGILLILQQCVLDEDNPFLREWGLLTVSYLLEGNDENQREVASLEMQEPVNTAEIDELGLRVEIDRERRRAMLVNNTH